MLFINILLDISVGTGFLVMFIDLVPSSRSIHHVFWRPVFGFFISRVKRTSFSFTIGTFIQYYITPSHQYTCNSTLTFIPAWALLHTSPSNPCQLFHLLYIFSSSLYVPIIPNEHVLILTFYQCPLFDNHTLLRIPPCRLFYVHWNHSLLTAKKRRKK